MNLSQLQEEISIIVYDLGFTPEIIEGYINDCIEYINSIIVLPGRKAITVVPTTINQAYSALDTVSGLLFNIRILRASCSSGPLKIYNSLETMFDDYSSDNVGLLEAGELEAVVLEGNTLWYQKVPTVATDITLLYYRKVPELSDANDSPLDIPKGLHRSLLVHGTCWIIYSQIEEDTEGGMENTKNHFWQSFDERNPHSGIVKLREWVGRSRKHKITSIWNV
jgi:hypothetical protein